MTEPKVVAKGKIWSGALATYNLETSRCLPILLLNHVFIYNFHLVHVVWDMYVANIIILGTQSLT